MVTKVELWDFRGECIRKSASYRESLTLPNYFTATILLIHRVQDLKSRFMS